MSSTNKTNACAYKSSKPSLLTDNIRAGRKSFGNNCKHLKPSFVLQNSFLQGIQVILEEKI